MAQGLQRSQRAKGMGRSPTGTRNYLAYEVTQCSAAAGCVIFLVSDHLTGKGIIEEDVCQWRDFSPRPPAETVKDRG